MLPFVSSLNSLAVRTGAIAGVWTLWLSSVAAGHAVETLALLCHRPSPRPPEA